MRDTGHYSESLQDLLDGRLPPDEEADVRAHLVSCALCRGELVRLDQGRAAARALGVDRELPEGLASKLAAALDAEDADRLPRQKVTSRAARLRSTNRRMVLWGGVAASLCIMAVLWWSRSAGDAPVMAARDFDSVVAGSTSLTFVTADPARLERDFADARSASVRVFDLAMMGFSLEGGRWHTFAGQASALYVYRNAAGDRVVCQMYEGTTSDLPVTGDVRSHRDFRFHVYREGDVTVVFWQEGKIVCVLASRLPQEAVVQLAFEKAMRPA